MAEDEQNRMMECKIRASGSDQAMGWDGDADSTTSTTSTGSTHLHNVHRAPRSKIGMDIPKGCILARGGWTIV